MLRSTCPGPGSLAVAVASVRIGRIASSPSPTPVMPTPTITRRDDHGTRRIHTRVSKGHNGARRACDSHASQQKPDYELSHRLPPVCKTGETGELFAYLDRSVSGPTGREDSRNAGYARDTTPGA